MPTHAELMAEVYAELRGLAGQLMARGPAQTLQPTALVHEAYLKLARRSDAWESRAHFFAVAAKAMRQVLSNHARDRRAQKRGGGWDRVTLRDASGETEATEVDLIALHEALEALAAVDARKADLVELRFFGGLTMPEIAEYLGVSIPTLEVDWRVAKAWIGARLA